ncbi:MAG: phage tail sheath family protein [Paludibacteraceae bacterium]|nr:phage tail sheath family protein [Paludibacteraceae bacterium]
MADYKTPGVYVEEISKFPPSVAGVATAIPAFIGFTAKCPKDRDGNPIKQPIKVTSMVDYENKFGGAPTLQIENDVLKNNEFVMYDSMRLFYDNGGGVCYVSSIGQYKEGKEFCTEDLSKNISTYKNAVKPLEKVDEVTLLLFPDAALILDEKDLAALHQEALKHCGEMGDRFAILDVKDLEDDNDKLGKTLEKFRGGVGTNYLCYGAAYYPYLKTTYPKEISFQQLKEQNSRIKTYIAEIKNNESNALKKPFTESIKQYENTVDYSNVIGNVKTAITEELGKIAEISNFTVVVDADGKEALRYNNESVEDGKELGYASKAYQEISDKKKSGLTLKAAVDFVNSDYSTKITSLKSMLEDIDSYVVAEGVLKCDDMVVTQGDGTTDLEKMLLTEIANTTDSIKNKEKEKEIISKALIRQIDQYAVSKGLDSYSDILADYQDRAQIITPSAAIAGIYAMVDANKGVWQAPANVSVSAVSDVMEYLSDRDQDDMNVDVNAGKSVNAIRSFSGKGIIVWGARTLDGNSNEWRYVPVRRLFNYIEESVQKSTNWAVFQPNDANTWVKVRCQIENFLSNLWRDGALAGSTPDKAFYVRVGLDETMTAQDILEGKMIVEIGLAAVRPAEFIILKFSHKLQEA